MKLHQKENYTLIQSDSGSLNLFIEEFNLKFNLVKDEHLVIDLLNVPIKESKDLIALYETSTIHRNRNKSFIIVSKNIEIDQLPEDFIVVPTLHEALDTVELEAIEREISLD